MSKIADGLPQAMVEVVLDQGSLGIANCALDRMQLLREIKAWTTFLDHGDDAPEVTFRPLQAFCDLRMGVVPMFCHN
jgi:hypothetical protein